IRLSRERSCSVEMPGSVRWSSTKRRGPEARSRTISRVHLSPTRSSARASGDHWSYGCRLGGCWPGIGVPPWSTGRRGDRFRSLSRSWRFGLFRKTLAASLQVLSLRGVPVDVGVLIDLEDRRRRRTLRAESLEQPGAQLYVDLADPFSYLTAERVERAFTAVSWHPVWQEPLECRRSRGGVHAERLRA